jgi:hypothetical protein
MNTFSIKWHKTISFLDLWVFLNKAQAMVRDDLGLFNKQVMCQVLGSESKLVTMR